MPSILFHMRVGYKFAQKYNEFDTKEFYLGLTVPDAVNCHGFAEKDKRWSAHKRDASLDIWQENILKFFNENKGVFDEHYLMGYLVHVLTDIVCDRIYQSELYPMLVERGYDYSSAYSYYEEGIEKYENSMISSHWWEYAKKLIKEAIPVKINDIDEMQISDWIDYNIDKYSKRKKCEEGFITEDFVDKVISEIKKIIEGISDY